MILIGIITLILINSASSCPIGSIHGLDDSTCYRYFVGPGNFQMNEENCQLLTDNGHLAAIVNSFENSFITDLLRDYTSDLSMHVWLGGNKLQGGWNWTNGMKFSYTNWDKGEPSNGSCIVISPATGRWSTKDCSLQLPYFCEILAQPSPLCETGWIYFNSSCYMKYYHLNSTDAENYCILNGAHLTSIHSPDENNFIADFARTGMIFENGHEAQVYIGLNTFTQAGVYKWTDGTQLDYVNWAGGTPSNPNINPCVTLFADMDSRYESWYQQWPRVLCTDIERAFVCKKPANK